MDEYGDEPQVDTETNGEEPEVETVEEYGESEPSVNIPAPPDLADQNPGFEDR